MRTLLAFAIVAGLSAAAAADATDPKAKAASEFAEGQRLYDANNYAAAAAKFKAAWELDHDPAYLFNIAQALRFAKQCNDAADYYRKFLAQVTSAPNLDKVHEYLAEVDACAKTQQPPPPPPQPANPEPTPRAASGGSNLKWYFGGAALVLAGGGLFWHHDAVTLSDNQRHYNTECPCTAAKLTEYDDRGHRAEVLAVVFDVAAGAALVTAIVLAVRDRGTEQPPVALAPMRGGALVTTGWSF